MASSGLDEAEAAEEDLRRGCGWDDLWVAKVVVSFEVSRLVDVLSSFPSWPPCDDDDDWVFDARAATTTSSFPGKRRLSVVIKTIPKTRPN